MPDFSSLLGSLGISGASSAGGSSSGGLSGILNTQTVDTALNTVTGLPISPILSALGLPDIGQSLSDVFSNGMNLSCIGASLTPSVATGRISTYYKPYMNWLFGKIGASQTKADLQAAVNLAINEIYCMWFYYAKIKETQADWSSCAKKAIHDVYQPFFNTAKQKVDGIIAQLTQQGATQTMGSRKPAMYVIPGAITGKDDYGNQTGGGPVPYPILDLTKISVPSVSPVAPPDELDASVTTGGEGPKNASEGDVPAQGAESTGLSPLAWGGIALAAKLLLT
jgi:hypothetical protein